MWELAHCQRGPGPSAPVPRGSQMEFVSVDSNNHPSHLTHKWIIDAVMVQQTCDAMGYPFTTGRGAKNPCSVWFLLRLLQDPQCYAQDWCPPKRQCKWTSPAGCMANKGHLWDNNLYKAVPLLAFLDVKHSQLFCKGWCMFVTTPKWMHVDMLDVILNWSG